MSYDDCDVWRHLFLAKYYHDFVHDEAQKGEGRIKSAIYLIYQYNKLW